MAISVLYNIPSLAAENQLKVTNMDLQNTLYQLSTGSRINSGADDAAGLAIANGLGANVTALTQSALNATEGAGKLQVADGALSQVTTLLNRAVTLATESANGTINDGAQRQALDAEFTAIKAEIDRIGTNTTYNGTAIFDVAKPTVDTFISDSTAAGSSTISVTLGQFDSQHINGSDLSGDNLTTAANAKTALTDINTAISNVAALRGNIGADVNRLQAAGNVVNNQIQNLTSAESSITSADIPTEVANLTKYSILNQTGISALAQANQMQQAVL